MHEKEQPLSANTFGYIFSPFISFPSPEQKANRTSSKDHKSNCSAEKLLIVLAQLTSSVLPTHAFKLKEKLMQKRCFPYPQIFDSCMC